MIDDDELEQIISSGERDQVLRELRGVIERLETAMVIRLSTTRTAILTAQDRHLSEHGHRLSFGCCADAACVRR